MPITIQPPQPGDLITSSFVKQLIDQLVALDVRMTTLEALVSAAPGVYIYSILPSSDVVMGTEVRLIGRGFGIAAENVVTIDDAVSITTFKEGSTDNQLIFTMPLIIFSGGSKPAKIRVSNPRGFYETTFTLTSGTPTSVEGTIRFDPPASFQRTAATGGPNVLSGAIIKFPVKISTNLDETFTLTPSTPATMPGWTASIVDSSGAARSSELLVAKNEAGTQFEMFVLIQGATTTGPGSVRLTVTSKRNSVLSRAADLSFNLGVPPLPTATVSVTLRSANPPARPDGALVKISPTATTLSAILEFDALLPTVDTGGEIYTATATVTGAGWTVTPATVDSPNLSAGAPPLFRPAFRVTASSNTVGPMTLTITVRSDRNSAHFGVLNQGVQLG